MGRRGAVGGCAAAAAADLVEVAVGRALVAGEAHRHALALDALGSGGPHHLALLAVHDLVAALEGLTPPREVDLLSNRVAAWQRRWRLAAYLCDQYLLMVGMYPQSVVRGMWGSSWQCSIASHAPYDVLYVKRVALQRW